MSEFVTKLIRYMAQIIILYFALRYLPFLRLDTIQAFTITMLVMILCFSFEMMLTSYAGESSVENMLENFKDVCNNKCKLSCNIENFDNQTKTTEEEKKDKFVKSHIKGGFGGMFYDGYDENNAIAIGDDKQLLSDLRQREQREKDNLKAYYKALEDRATSTSGYETAYQEPGDKSQKRIVNPKNRRIDGDLDNELPYSDYNHLPVASGYKSHDYEYGYSFIPPEKWYPQPVRPPICVTDYRCPVMPTYTNGTPVDVKEFYSANRISPPDQMSDAYVQDKLNAGR